MGGCRTDLAFRRDGRVDMNRLPPILDAHAHLWRHSHTQQPWIDPQTMAAIARDFWLTDLLDAQGAAAAAIGATSAGTVLVQSANSASETRDLLKVSTDASVRGVVGWIDLHGDVADQVGRLRSAAGGEQLCGIRHLAHQDADPQWLTRPATLAGFVALAELELPFDIVVLPTQLATVIDAVKLSPGTRFVLDHLGKPPIASGDLSDWMLQVRSLARLPNVVAKLSGLVTEASWHGWTQDDLEPVVDTALDSFGPSRLMFGSDWPVVQLSGGYARWITAADELLRPLSGSELAAIFAGTAADYYGVEI